jgi:hypothetical protein
LVPTTGEVERRHKIDIGAVEEHVIDGKVVNMGISRCVKIWRISGEVE